jgi:hypothetical protein
MNVNWIKCKNNNWCSLNTVDLQSNHFDNLEGVYVIWCGDGGSCIKVGQGNIQDRIAAHRKDPDIQEYSNRNLLASWAELSPQHHDGVEAYLADRLNPLAGERYPNVQRITINLPGE